MGAGATGQWQGSVQELVVGAYPSCNGLVTVPLRIVAGDDAVELAGSRLLATHSAVEARLNYRCTLHFNNVCTSLLVDGGWSDWSQGECSVSCGGGLRNLSRTCTNPSPSCNGSECVGEDFRTEKCNMQCCLGTMVHLTNPLIL